MTPTPPPLRAVALVIVMPLACLSARADTPECVQKGAVTRQTEVWDQPPKLLMGKGWEFGKPLGSLPAGTSVYICQEKTIGFALRTQLWYQVAYGGGAREDRQLAWAAAEAIQKIDPRGQQKLGALEARPKHRAFPRQAGVVLLARRPEAMFRGAMLPPEYELYVYLFLAMILGMMAERGVTAVKSPAQGGLKQTLREGVVPFLVSPMVYLGLLTARETLPAEPGMFIVALCHAFQNGFFWQAVFSGLSSRAKEGVKDPALAPNFA